MEELLRKYFRGLASRVVIFIVISTESICFGYSMYAECTVFMILLSSYGA